MNAFDHVYFYAKLAVLLSCLSLSGCPFGDVVRGRETGRFAFIDHKICIKANDGEVIDYMTIYYLSTKMKRLVKYEGAMKSPMCIDPELIKVKGNYLMLYNTIAGKRSTGYSVTFWSEGENAVLREGSI